MSVLERAERATRATPRRSRSTSFRETARAVKRDAMDRIGYNEMARIADADDLAQARDELRVAVEAVLNADDSISVDAAERNELIENVIDDVVGLGPLQTLLEDDSVTEIMVNGCVSA